jgi:hypothetical protein
LSEDLLVNDRLRRIIPKPIPIDGSMNTTPQKAFVKKNIIVYQIDLGDDVNRLPTARQITDKMFIDNSLNLNIRCL